MIAGTRGKDCRFWALAIVVSLLSSGCASRVGVSRSRSATITPGASWTDRDRSADGAQLVEPVDLDAEEAVSVGSLSAWRRALAGDEAGALRQLEELDKKYPKAITVRFMIGQVLERAGKKQEAVKYYRQAVRQSQFNTIYLFKLAESLRTTGDAEAAAENYRQVLEIDPQFAPARLGLARALWSLDKNSEEARRQAARALVLEPNNQEAKVFLGQMGPIKR